MKTAIVNFSEISDRGKNPTLCMSAVRYTNGCTECKVFLDAFNRDLPLRCKPMVDDARIKELQDKEKAKIKRLKARIDKWIDYLKNEVPQKAGS